MHCPNCGLQNADDAKFCANCGTPVASSTNTAYAQQPARPYSFPNASASVPGTGNSLAKNIGLGCLIAVLIFLFLGLSCTRACFSSRYRRVNVHRRY